MHLRSALFIAMTTSWMTVVAAGCGASERPELASRTSPTQPGGSGGGGGGLLGSTPPSDAPDPTSGGCEKMDIVFVVDDSGSMGEEQENLAANFPKFVSILDGKVSGSGVPLDYRVAVTTTGKSYKLKGPFGFSDSETGDDGAFRNDCGGTKRWLEKTEAAASFPCRAAVGTGGPSEEMPLECMKLALDDRMKDGTNAGFLRDDALLAVVFLTDEDDCSFKATELNEGFGDVCEDGDAEQPESYVAVLDQIKGDRARWATAVIAGKTSCQSAFGSAAEAKRLKQFVSATGKNAVFSSICEGDLSIALTQALDTFGEACKSFPAGPK